MTTIVYRDGVLVADTQATIGTSTCMYGCVKIMQRGSHFAACTGSAAYMGDFFQWFRSNERGKPPTQSSDGEESICAIYRPDGLIDLFEKQGSFSIKLSYHAMGSGRDVALGALYVGASAEQALRAAIHHDAFTGGEITILRRRGSK